MRAERGNCKKAQNGSISIKQNCGLESLVANEIGEFAGGEGPEMSRAEWHLIRVGGSGGCEQGQAAKVRGTGNLASERRTS